MLRPQRQTETTVVVHYEDGGVCQQGIGNGPKEVPRDKAKLGQEITMLYNNRRYIGRVVFVGNRREAAKVYEEKSEEEKRKKRRRRKDAGRPPPVDIPTLADPVVIDVPTESGNPRNLAQGVDNEDNATTQLGNGDNHFNDECHDESRMENCPGDRQDNSQSLVAPQSPTQNVESGFHIYFPSSQDSQIRTEERNEEQQQQPSISTGNRGNKVTNVRHSAGGTKITKDGKRKRTGHLVNENGTEARRNSLTPTNDRTGPISYDENGQGAIDHSKRNGTGINNNSRSTANDENSSVNTRTDKLRGKKQSNARTANITVDELEDQENLSLNELRNDPRHQPQLSGESEEEDTNPVDDPRDDNANNDDSEDEVFRQRDELDARRDFNGAQQEGGDEEEEREKRRKQRRRRLKSPVSTRGQYRPGKVVITYDTLGNKTAVVDTLYGPCRLSKREIQAYLNFCQESTTGIEHSSAVRNFFRGFFKNWEERTASTRRKGKRVQMTQVEQELFFTMIHEQYGHAYPFLLDDGVVRSTEEETGEHRRYVINSLVQLPSDVKMTRKRQRTSDFVLEPMSLKCACGVTREMDEDGGLCTTCWHWFCYQHAVTHTEENPKHSLCEVPRRKIWQRQ